jgi:hypothetical protein
MAILDKSFGAAQGSGNMPDKVNIKNQSQKKEEKDKHPFTFKSGFSQMGTRHEWSSNQKNLAQEEANKPWAPSQNKQGFFKKPGGK